MHGSTFATMTHLDLMKDRPDWQELGACRTADPEAFFPEKGSPVALAKDICRKCDVKDRCLEYALGRDEQFGIWGGLTEQERRNVKRRAA